MVHSERNDNCCHIYDPLRARDEISTLVNQMERAYLVSLPLIQLVKVVTLIIVLQQTYSFSNKNIIAVNFVPDVPL